MSVPMVVLAGWPINGLVPEVLLENMKAARCHGC